jgi:hypothetical protein
MIVVKRVAMERSRLIVSRMVNMISTKQRQRLNQVRQPRRLSGYRDASQRSTRDDACVGPVQSTRRLGVGTHWLSTSVLTIVKRRKTNPG